MKMNDKNYQSSWCTSRNQIEEKNEMKEYIVSRKRRKDTSYELEGGWTDLKMNY